MTDFDVKHTAVKKVWSNSIANFRDAKRNIEEIIIIISFYPNWRARRKVMANIWEVDSRNEHEIIILFPQKGGCSFVERIADCEFVHLQISPSSPSSNVIIYPHYLLNVCNYYNQHAVFGLSTGKMAPSRLVLYLLSAIYMVNNFSLRQSISIICKNKLLIYFFP